MPCLKEVRLNLNKIPAEQRRQYPYNIPALKTVDQIALSSNVTFFVGENGSGKSTLLEAIATACGFSSIGGQHSLIDNPVQEESLAKALTLSWFPRLTTGFFFRSETFFNFACYIDELAKEWGYGAYGGKSLHQQSHGESFLATFVNRFSRQGLYLLDEPEAALSPQNQLAFLKIIHDLETEHQAQFIIATHSPILLGYPEADIYSFDGEAFQQIQYEDTPQVQITRDFLLQRNLFLKHLFKSE